MSDHPPAHCCRHVFTPACPIDCLRMVLSTATFHALARAEQAPFDPPATAGQVLHLWHTGRLGLAFGLGPRRLGEITAGLVLAGFDLDDATGPAPGQSATPGSGPACAGDEERPSW